MDCTHMPRKALTMNNRRQWIGQALALVVATSTSVVHADDGPNSSLFSGRMQTNLQPAMQPGMPAMSAAPGLGSPSSWYETPLPPPKEVRVNDIITIRVDLGSQVVSESEFQSRKNAQYNLLLSEWIKLDGLKSVKPTAMADGEPQINGSLNQLNRVTGELETTEQIKFEIAATVASVLPNGNLVVEAHRSVQNNHEQWMHSLSGVVRREDIGPGNIVLSKDMANLQISKRENGQVRDTYRRGWVNRWLDTFNPF